MGRYKNDKFNKTYFGDDIDQKVKFFPWFLRSYRCPNLGLREELQSDKEIYL